jgi:hypothetical protein
MTRSLLLLQGIHLSEPLSHLQQYLDGNYIRWMSRLLSSTGKSKKKFTLSSLKASYSIIKELMYVNLRKLLYGLKQAPRAWYGRIDSFLQSLGFTKSIADPNLYAVKHILRYVRGTIAYSLRYTSSGGVILHGLTDSDCMGSVVDRKSTSGYCFSLGSAMISWSSRKQSSIAQSIAEAEYTAASAASREAVWLRKLLSDLFRTELEPTVIHCDNQSCIKLTENPVFHDRSKLIEMRYHYIRDMIQRKFLSLQYVPSAEQTADIFTKPLPLMLNLHAAARAILLEDG